MLVEVGADSPVVFVVGGGAVVRLADGDGDVGGAVRRRQYLSLQSISIVIAGQEQCYNC